MSWRDPEDLGSGLQTVRMEKGTSEKAQPKEKLLQIWRVQIHGSERLL